MSIGGQGVTQLGSDHRQVYPGASVIDVKNIVEEAS